MGFKQKTYRSRLAHRCFLVLIVVICLSTVGFFGVPGGFYVPNASAVTTSPNVGVYWNQACTKPVSSIIWGNVSMGSERDVVVFVKNLGSEALVLSMNMSALSPPSAYLKIYLCWNSQGRQVMAGDVIGVILRLFVTPEVAGISNFSFIVNIGVGLTKNPDANGDGVVNTKDLSLFCAAWGATAGQPRYDYRCDLNNDGIINSADLAILAAHWFNTP